MKRYILTGAPGTGKTSLIEAFEEKGFHVIHEAATDVIAKEQVLGNLKPWELPNFIDKVVVLQKQRQQQADICDSPLQFYDRSPICTYALAVYLGFKPSTHLLDEIKRIEKNNIYEKRVLCTLNLGFIVETEARRISFEESLKFEQIHFDVYQSFGYECIKIPPASIDKRIENILRFI